MASLSRRNIGQDLNKKWGVNARHALYRKDGTWYHRLNRFPAALFDENGYVLFETELEYLHCQHLQLGKQINCRKGISSISTYVQVRNELDHASDLAEPEGVVRTLSVTNRIVRDTPLARRVKRLHGNKCQVCGFVLKLSNEKSYAEAHHIKPLGSVHNGPDVAENIICVCPNCHVLLDYGAVKLNIASLKSIPEHNIQEKYVGYHNATIYKG